MAVKASNQITILDITDGYAVILSTDSHTFTGTTTGVQGTQTITSLVQAFLGSEQKPCSVAAITGLPTGLSIVSDGKTPAPTLTITATSALTRSGTVLIPITVGELTITRSFNYAIAFKGTTGATGSNGTSVTVTKTEVTYQVAAQGTTAPTGTWSTTIPALPEGQFLWTRTIVTYSDGKMSTAYSVSRNGVTGKDAITIALTSSNGSIFKNTSIATVLTAHVYKGGTPLSGSALTSEGTIKWYKDEDTISMATGENLTIQAGDVENQANYTAKLEG